MSVKARTNTALAASKRALSGERRAVAKRTLKVRDPERTSAAILAAAVEEFSAKGYSGARVDAIAERAGINKRMLYHYFGDKDALYVAVLEGAYTKIRFAERALQLSDRDPEEAIRELVRFTWNYFLENPEFLSLLGSENLHHAKFLKRSARIFDLHSPLVSVISDVLERGVRAGKFRRGIDPVQLYVTIASLGFFYLSNKWTLSTIFRRDLMRPEELEAWGMHITDVVLSFVTSQNLSIG
jgi:TetR/AcrR family transcriptional regulator